MKSLQTAQNDFKLAIIKIFQNWIWVGFVNLFVSLENLWKILYTVYIPKIVS